MPARVGRAAEGVRGAADGLVVPEGVDVIDQAILDRARVGLAGEIRHVEGEGERGLVVARVGGREVALGVWRGKGRGSVRLSC